MAAQTEMDANQAVVWNGKLPEEIEANIQARLEQVSDLMRSSAVCKAWRAALASPVSLREALEWRVGRAGREECLLFIVGLCNSRIASCFYTPASGKWHRHPLPPWLQALTLGPDSPQGMLELPMSGGSRSTGGGVLLSTMYMHGDQKVVIPHLGNPAAHSWTCLPELPANLRLGHVLGIYVDARARSFKLVALYETRFFSLTEPIPTFVFDSERGTWSVTTWALPNNESLNSTMSDQGAFVGSVLYCVAGYYNRGCNLLAYDLEEASWSWMDVSMPSVGQRIQVIHYYNLINLRGRLLCVVLGKDVGIIAGDTMFLQVWEMDFEIRTWKVVDTMPAPMLIEFLGTRHCPWGPARHLCRCLHHVIPLKVVALPNCQVYIMNDEEVDRIVQLDLGRAPPTWRWLPSWPWNHLVRKSLHCVNPCLDLGSWIKHVEKHA